MTTDSIISKVWSFCHTLRDDGVGYGDYLEQQELVRQQFEAVERNEREIDAALKRSEALRQSILKKAFTGQLVPQDPADEPAAALLARLRTGRDAAPGKSRRRSSSAK